MGANLAPCILIQEIRRVERALIPRTQAGVFDGVGSLDTQSGSHSNAWVHAAHSPLTISNSSPWSQNIGPIIVSSPFFFFGALTLA